MPQISKERALWQRLLLLPWQLFVWSVRRLFRAIVYAWHVRVLRPALVASVPLLALLVIYTMPPLAFVADVINIRALHYSAAAGLRLDDITIEGRKRTQRADIQQAVQLTRGQPIFATRLSAIHARVVALPWVKHAVIMRRLPNKIHIVLYEYEPFALYRDGKTPVLIDRAGVRITYHHLHQFKHLPLFSGEGALSRAADLMDMLTHYPVVRNRLVAARWFKDRRWILKLDHGGSVHLPDTDIEGALQRLMRLERERRVLAIAKQTIDLRLPDRILLRPENTRARGSASRIDEVPS